MELLVFVLNNIEKLDELLIELSNSGLKGATILNSMGMASSIYNSKKQETQNLIINSLKIFFFFFEKENRIIFSVVDKKQQEIFYKVVDRIIGPLSKENTGIIFTIPVSSTQGINLK